MVPRSVILKGAKSTLLKHVTWMIVKGDPIRADSETQQTVLPGFHVSPKI